ncbi:MAG: hypothetical protein PCFJNLEI_01629 [Verrucomicrobiae bacterium]|nr:hypothetical protein [Verrucomicrobiae bacterium]
MYSPKIDEKLIPVLYRAAKARGIPMTTLVNRLLTEALVRETVPAPAVSRPQVDVQLAA